MGGESDRMVTGVEEEMKVTSNDDTKQQDKPTETSQHHILSNQPIIHLSFHTSHTQFPRFIFLSLPFAFLQPRAYLPLANPLFLS